MLGDFLKRKSYIRVIKRDDQKKNYFFIEILLITININMEEEKSRIRTENLSDNLILLQNYIKRDPEYVFPNVKIFLNIMN